MSKLKDNALQSQSNLKTPDSKTYSLFEERALANVGAKSLIERQLEANRRIALDILPKPGDIILAYIIHVEKISITNSGLSTTSNDYDPALGYFGKSSSSSQKQMWYKAYGFVDFYSSCLPFPEITQADQMHLSKALKGVTDPVKLLGAHSMLRISRFPYFLVPENAVASWTGGVPEVGSVAQVKFLDNDNFSYGVLVGLAHESPLTPKEESKKQTHAQQRPLGAPANARENLERGN